ncbi:MAG: cysteine desulfurase family protein [Moraxellaceae bacterium]|nr:cysteine desulfurase family protein [Moraxellaceae bacterium]
MFAPVYLDHNATTPLDERVFAVMEPFLRDRFGNASSRHEYGRHARAAIDTARAQVADAVGAHPSEVVFTSGGSEANNLFVKGAAGSQRGGVIAIGASEHPCVREPARQLVGQGWRMLELPVMATGHLNTTASAALIAQHRPRLVSAMLANNETGALSNVMALVEPMRQAGGWLHTDAVQALGKITLDFRALGVQAMTLSSHKIGGPIGAGALVVAKRVDIAAQIAGGGHERGLRSGTENVAAIAGFGRACELASQELEARATRMQAARDRLEERLLGLGARPFGGVEPRLPNTSYFGFDNIDGETLVAKMDRAGFAIASGAACSSANPEPSRTLLAMGVEPDVARTAVRVSMGPHTSLEDVDRFAETIGAMLIELKRMAAVAV